MNTIERTVSSLSLGKTQRHRNLAMFPLLSKEAVTPSYRMLDEALADGRASVTEVSEGGSVPELAFDNKGGELVLLVDGEELKGARQNRILNITILVGAGQKLVIPVSCVERGRWSYTKRDFGASDRVLFAKARAAKHVAVNQSMSCEGVARSDQGRIWAEIDARLASAKEQSRTASMADLYASEADKLSNYERAFTWQPGQAGADIAIDGVPVAVEVFDAPETFRKLLRKLVGSFAMDAVAAHRPRSRAPSPRRRAALPR